MTDANANLFWAIWFRALQGALEAAPTLLCGVAVAGLLRGVVGPEPIRRWFAADWLTGPLRACAAGLLLPVCSLGAMPVAWELRRAGVPRASVVTFLLAAPLVNAFGLLYGIQRMNVQGAMTLGAFAFVVLGCVAIVLGTGILLGRTIPEVDPPRPLVGLPKSEFRRLGIAGLTAARGLSGPLLGFVAIALACSGLLAAVHGGALERAVNERSLAAPLQRAIVSTAAYIAPMKGIGNVCDLLLARVPLGKMLLLFLLGVGPNVGTLLWIACSYGFRTLMVTLVIVVGAALAVDYGLPLSLPATALKEEPKIHFLEIEAGGTSRVARLRAIRTTLTSETGEKQWLLIAACGAIGCLALVGLGARLVGEVGRTEHWLEPADPSRHDVATSSSKVKLSRSQLTLAAVAIVVLAVLAGLWIYYPAPEELLNEMDEVQFELAAALKSDNTNYPRAIELVDQWQAIGQRLVIARMLRGGRLESDLRNATNELRAALNRLRTALRDRSSGEELEALYRAAREAATHCGELIENKTTP